ncbi:hypothetical protein ACIQFZ_12225 [Streptomyces sp. NPDC093064]|uniref:hypothetical protein n=1 Tax=unclassified Streptomyces TaxID=2593676 RepID=UPI0036CB86FE
MITARLRRRTTAALPSLSAVLATTGRDRPHHRGPGTDRRPACPRFDDRLKAAADRRVGLGRITPAPVRRTTRGILWRNDIVGACPVDRTTKTEILNGCESNPYCRPWH